MIYEIIELDLTKFIKATDLNGKVIHIPFDESNSDYQAYLNKDKPQVEHLTDKLQ